MNDDHKGAVAVLWRTEYIILPFWRWYFTWKDNQLWGHRPWSTRIVYCSKWWFFLSTARSQNSMKIDEQGRWYYLECWATPPNVGYFIWALWSYFMNVDNPQSWYYLWFAKASVFVPYLLSFWCWNCRDYCTHQWWCFWSYCMRSSLLVCYLSGWSRPVVWTLYIDNIYDLLGLYCIKAASVICGEIV